MGAARAGAIVAIFVGSQALPGLTPRSFAARGPSTASPRIQASRPPSGAPAASRALLQRRLDRARSFPHRVGGVRRNPWITGGKAPLLAPSLTTGQLARTTPFAGVPDTVHILGLRVDFQTDRLGSQ